MSYPVTKEYIEQLLDKSIIEEHKFHQGKSLIVSYLLPNGFTVDGRASLVNIENFDIDIGRRVAREDAFRQLWKLEAYKYH